MISCSNHPRQTPHHLSFSDLGRAQNRGPTESGPLRTTRVPEPERLGPGSSAQGRPLDCSRQNNLEPEQCGQGGYTRRERGQTQCGRGTASTCQCYLFAASLPPHSATEQVSLKKKKKKKERKKCPPPSPLCQGGNQTLKRPANRRSYNRGKRLGSYRP